MSGHWTFHIIRRTTSVTTYGIDTSTGGILMASYRIISSDSHVFEPADLWTSRIDRAFRERAPRVVHDGQYDQWVVEGNKKVGSIGLVSQAGVRFQAPEKITFAGSYQDVRPGGWDPLEHVKDMEIDGVSGGVLYTSNGLFFFRIPDSALLSAIFRAYNDWLAEFCRACPQQLKGIAMVNVDDASEGIKELQRAAKLGLSGGMIAVSPLPDRPYSLPMYDPFWAAAQDLGMPISLHTATQRPGPGVPTLDNASQTATQRANIDYWVRTSLCDMLYAGVFERYPKLQVAAVEFELSWVPYFLRMLDYVYVERQQQATYRFKNQILPSDFFRSNVYLSFQEDDLGIRLRDLIGVDRLMWGSDYPHAESTWPKSQEILDRILAQVPEAEKAKIAGQNVARLYHFDA
jgi:predicted TIM-barrel fold metal-dependent hydrolase